jgi:hypothetical protein
MERCTRMCCEQQLVQSVGLGSPEQRSATGGWAGLSKFRGGFLSKKRLLFLSIMSSRLHRDHDGCLIFETHQSLSDVGVTRINAGPLPVVSSHEKKVGNYVCNFHHLSLLCYGSNCCKGIWGNDGCLSISKISLSLRSTSRRTTTWS